MQTLDFLNSHPNYQMLMPIQDCLTIFNHFANARRNAFHIPLASFVEQDDFKQVILEHWSTGALEHWSTGALEHWSTGALEHWSTGSL